MIHREVGEIRQKNSQGDRGDQGGKYNGSSIARTCL